MRANRRRHANIVPIASLATGVLLALFVCGAGIYCVWCKNRLHSIGNEIKGLERRLVELRSQNEVAKTKIARLSSKATLNERRSSNFFAKLGKFDDILTWESNTSAARADDEDVRPVRNRSARP